MNMKIHIINLYVGFTLLGVQPLLAYAEFVEPDLSEVTLDVEYALSADGQWKYHYTVHNGSTIVLESLFIDISCKEGTEIADDVSSLGQGEGYLDPSKYPGIERLREGVHVPTRIDAAYGSAIHWGITMGNEAFWFLKTNPQSTDEGLVLTSKGSPVMRNFRITPYPLLDEAGGEEHWEDEEDYNLYGLVMGPSCNESSDAPIDDPNEVIFEGTPPREIGINDVLTYSEPLQSRFTVAAKEISVSMTVHYSSEMDPDTFRVEPGWARELFTAAPGGSETVTLPLNMGLNRFRLEAMKEGGTPSDWTSRDLDIFEIRRGRVPPGQSKKQ